MSAPKRIWAIPDMDDVPRRHWDCGVWREDRADALDVHGEPVIEYVRADIHAATLARAERAEAELSRLRKAIEQKGGNEHYPTEEAYLRACAAIEKHRERVDAREKAEALLKEAVEALNDWQSAGCPYCQGDCASANPPMSWCIMETTRAILARIQDAP